MQPPFGVAVEWLEESLELTELGRILIAGICGVILGLPSEMRKRPGGITTHLLVAIGCALFCATALDLARDDPGELVRMLQGVATGIGFVGGAAVIKQGEFISGLRTAASIWITGAAACEAVLGKPGAALAAAVVTSLLNLGIAWLQASVLATREKRASFAEREDNEAPPPGS